jgi:hypothetical protein
MGHPRGSHYSLLCACRAGAIQSFHQRFRILAGEAIGAKQACRARRFERSANRPAGILPRLESCSVSVTRKEFLNKTINLRYYSPILTDSHVSAPL